MIRQAHPPLPRTPHGALPSLRSGLAAFVAGAALMGLLAGMLPAQAQDGRPTRPAAQNAKPAASGNKPAASSAKPAASNAKPAASAAKPTLLATIGDWGVYATAAGRERTCYALAQPTSRAPSNLKRDAAYLFISTRPAENVRNEVSIIMGFDVQTDKTPAQASVGSDAFGMAAQGSHLWVRDANDGTPMIEAMRKGATLSVKAASLRGNVTTDTYSLSGVTAALARVQKECP